MSAEEIKIMSFEEKVKLALITKDRKLLELLAWTGNDYLKTIIARNIYTDPCTLERIAYSTENKVVMDAVLGNPLTFSSVRESILKKV